MRYAGTYRYLVAALIAVALAAGCTDWVVDADGPASRADNFDLLWQDFDRIYPYFPHKGIDWDSVYSHYAPAAQAAGSDAELAKLMGEMLLGLRDGHVNLFTPDDEFIYDGWFLNRPRNFDRDLILLHFLRGQFSTLNSGQIVVSKPLALAPQPGQLAGEPQQAGVLYLLVQSFLNRQSWLDDLHRRLDDAGEIDGFIIDVRNNGGGSDLAALELAGRFADQRRVFGFLQYRAGAARDALGAPKPRYLDPVRSPLLKPVVVLTNRRTFSAAESFVLAMRTLPHAIVVGDTTGGGSGNPINRELPNGWTYTISTWVERDAAMRIFEGAGIAPDVTVMQSSRDTSLGRDSLIDQAIDELRKRIFPQGN